METKVLTLTSKGVALVRAGVQFHLGALSAQSRYEIAPGYKHRQKPVYFDDTENTDNWQKEVYEIAKSLMIENGLRSVHDVGCGSGYKLVNILGQFETTGIDLPDTIAKVQSIYPDRRWISASFDAVDIPPADLVVCSDVIEHVPDPDALMRFLVRSSRDWVVLSTPDRDLLYSWKQRHRFGPPSHPNHMREWTMPELRRYVGHFLDVQRHDITNRQQKTQTIVARIRR